VGVWYQHCVQTIRFCVVVCEVHLPRSVVRVGILATCTETEEGEKIKNWISLSSYLYSRSGFGVVKIRQMPNWFHQASPTRLQAP